MLGRIPGLLALIMVLGFFGTMAALIFVPDIPRGAMPLLKEMITMLGIMLAGVTGFHFRVVGGPSSAKKEKTK